MDVYNIKNFNNGWFIGNFEPSIFKNCFFEVAHHKIAKGFAGPLHYHKIAEEVTYIVKGKLIADGRKLAAGDMFVYHPKEVSNVTFLEDTDLIVIKWPSVPTDKYIV
jgi:quercetin dioxygenase-like cupin family protein